MSDFDEDDAFGQDGGTGDLDTSMYETTENGGGLHMFNDKPNQYHRSEVLQRVGAVDITCNIEKVVHGALAPDSEYFATLIVMQWLFQPKNGARISEATIELLFEAEASETEIEVRDMSFCDTYSVMPTTQDESVTKGGEATVGIDQVGQLGLSGKWEKTTTKTTSDAITLIGNKFVVNHRGLNRRVTWNVYENSSQPAGIPASLKLAVLLARDDEERFRCKVAFECKTDLKTSFKRFFKKIPKDDPIIFQPNAED
jgi:hypothetical protein